MGTRAKNFLGPSLLFASLSVLATPKESCKAIVEIIIDEKPVPVSQLSLEEFKWAIKKYFDGKKVYYTQNASKHMVERNIAHWDIEYALLNAIQLKRSVMPFDYPNFFQAIGPTREISRLRAFIEFREDYLVIIGAKKLE